MRSSLVAVGLSLSASAFADEPTSSAAVEAVPASLLSVRFHDYDGKRVRTEFAIMAPLAPKQAKVLGCEKDDTAYMLGPKMTMGQAPAMLAGTWTICVSKEHIASVATAPMGSTIEVEGDMEVKGSSTSPRIALKHTAILALTPLTGE